MLQRVIRTQQYRNRGELFIHYERIQKLKCNCLNVLVNVSARVRQEWTRMSTKWHFSYEVT